MKLWKVRFTIDTGIGFVEKEAIVAADDELEAADIFKRSYILGYDESIHKYIVTEINFDPKNHSMIYCSQILRR